jgi:radical SAM protein with 4Fe4S-binding SPASM domain
MKPLSQSAFKTLAQYYLKTLRTLSFSRLLNYLKLETSFFVSTLGKRVIHLGNPTAVSIEPTTSCNLRCPECPSGSGKLFRPNGRMSSSRFSDIITKLPASVAYMTLYFQGEPFLHKELPKLIETAKKQGIMVATSTNGHFLNEDNSRKIVESGLDKIIISLDGADAATYTSYRQGGDYAQVVKGIETLGRIKREMRSLSPLISVQFLVFRQNEHQIKEIQNLAKKLGADVLELKTAQHYDYSEGNEFMTTLEKYSRYRKTASGKYVRKKELKNRCRRMWNSCVITWDGEMVPCCYDKNAANSYGNLLHNSFETIWKSPQAKSFRNQLFSERKEIEICNNCDE